MGARPCISLSHYAANATLWYMLLNGVLKERLGIK
jgi:hypothetical protein